jgi:hypothetical protein
MQPVMNVFVAPDKHDVGGVPLTDKERSSPYVLLSLLLHGVRSQLLSRCCDCCCMACGATSPLRGGYVASDEWVG